MLALVALAFSFFAFTATRRAKDAELDNERIRTSTGFFETPNETSVYIRPRKPPAPLVFFYDVKVPDQAEAYLVIRHGEPKIGQKLPPVILSEPIRGFSHRDFEAGHAFSVYVQRRKNGWWIGYDSATSKQAGLVGKSTFDWIEELHDKNWPIATSNKWQDVIEIPEGQTVELFAVGDPNSKKQFSLSVHNPKK